MTQLEKSVLLYTKIVSRLETEKRQKHLAKAYKQILEMMQTYTDIEKFMVDLEKSPLYYATAIATLKDKCEALIEGALQNKTEDVAKVYSQRLADLEDPSIDPMSIYSDSGFYNTAVNLKARYLNKMQAFADIFTDYTDLRCALPGNEGTYHKDLLKHFEDFERDTGLGHFDGDFEEVSKLEEYRRMIPAGDEAYEKFVKEAVVFRQTPPNYDDECAEIAQKGKAELDELIASQHEITAFGKEIKKRIKYAAEIYLPPADKTGSYTHTCEVVRDYE